MAGAGTQRDPRTHLPMEAGVRPVVALPARGLPGWVFVAAMAVAGILLFLVLDARRQAASAPSVRVRTAEGTAAPPPPLYVPPALPPATVTIVPSVRAPQPAPAPRPQPPQIIYVPQPAAIPDPVIVQPQPDVRTTSDPALVVDTTGGQSAPAAAATPAAGDAAASSANPGARARAGMFANRATTVQQGTLIQAVLETALDSTRPGFARAIVSRDIRGFDGSRVLIPRGSRLIGEYRSEVAPGQRRALVMWTRLVRPDGVTIAISSPAGDPLGRGGIRANVNSHFFERFTGAILQSALDIGVNLASRAGGSTIFYLPGTLQGITSQTVQPAQVTPTLTVKQGTSISIFVARDLDFTGADSRR
jgi:type IV secretion system protein VirB10